MTDPHPHPAELQEQIRPPGQGEVNYLSGIRASIRGYWLSVLSYDQWWEGMQATIRNGLTRAWHEGARDCGVSPEEYTAEEQQALAQAIFNEYSFIGGLAEDIEDNSKANGGELGPLLARADLWALRYADVRNQAKLAACGDQKLAWVLGDTVDHCPTCLRLAGIIKRASVWEKAGLHPQQPPNERLACGGWRCKCTMEVTTLYATPGPLPHGLGEFDPDQPRDASGKFTAGGGGGGGDRGMEGQPKFGKIDEANSWSKSVATLHPTVSEQEASSLRTYKGDAYYDINYSLREYNDPADDEQQEIVDNLDAVFAQAAPLDRDITVYRGGGSFDEEDLADSIIQDNAFVSTTLVEWKAKDFEDGSLIEIRIPQGAKAIAVDQYGGPFVQEAEILLPRGTRFRVLNDAGSGDEPRHMTWEVLL